MKRIAAFTIVELIIALLISSLVLSFSYYAYSFFSKQLITFRRQNEYAGDIFLIKKSLREDMNHAMNVQMAESNNELQFLFPSGEKIIYRIDSTGVNRIDQQGNSFFTIRDGAWTIHENPQVPHLIQRIKLTYTIGKQKMAFECNKEYSAAELMSNLKSGYE